MKKKNKKSLLITVIMLILSIGILNFQVFAKNNLQTTGYVNGKIKGQILFSATETSDAIKWIEDAKKSGEDYIDSEIKNTTDPDKLKHLNKNLSASKEKSVKDWLKIGKDGSSYIMSNLPYVKLVVDGNITVTVDENGFYSLENPSIGKHQIEIYHKDKFVRTEEINIKMENINKTKESNPTKDIDIILSSTNSQVNEAIERMSQSMASAQSYYLPEWFGYFSADFGSFNGSRWSGAPRGVEDSTGGYAMYFATPSGVVGCNKSDATLASARNFKNIGGTEGSDCKRAIAQGMMYSDNPNAYAQYTDSYNCYIEMYQQGLSLMGLSDYEGPNVYCDGSNKNGHYNCSWFYGIGHSEKLHTHDGSSTYYLFNYPYPGYLIKYGQTGSNVTLVQKRLKELGFYTGGIDGSFGPLTLSAVKSYQSSRGLSADGIVGPATWSSLFPRTL